MGATDVAPGEMVFISFPSTLPSLIFLCSYFEVRESSMQVVGTHRNLPARCYNFFTLPFSLTHSILADFMWLKDTSWKVAGSSDMPCSTDLCCSWQQARPCGSAQPASSCLRHFPKSEMVIILKSTAFFVLGNLVNVWLWSGSLTLPEMFFNNQRASLLITKAAEAQRLLNPILVAVARRMLIISGSYKVRRVNWT